MNLAIPAFGHKSHVSTDRRFGLIRTWTVTDAAAFDGARLPELLDRRNTARVVWADTAYRSATYCQGHFSLSIAAPHSDSTQS